ncbi:MAG: M20/M25/M40 family metallo-hydrolase [Chloroflexota bacterium]
MVVDLNWPRLLDDCVDFARRLIQTPSMPFQEAAVANLIAEEMRRLGFDEVWLDGMGNVCGRVYGRDRHLGAIVLNSHTDHVDPGDPSLWPALPYGGEIVNGRLTGRGACDIKGPLAVQVYSMAALLRAGERPRRDVVFTGVVQEEIGGAGAKYWVEHLDYPVGLVVLGEPSGNNLSLGHRGILPIWVTFHGRSVHASAPERGVNPNYALATFLQRLQAAQGELKGHTLLGRTSVAPTLIEVDTKSQNVTPAWTRVLLDFRTAAESANSLQAFVHRLAEGFPHTFHAGWGGAADQPLPDSDETIFGYYTPPESEVVRRARAAIAQGMGRPPQLTSYQFATDGRHFVPYGLPIIGYSAGEEHLAHTVNESIALDLMLESLRGHAQLLLEF